MKIIILVVALLVVAIISAACVMMMPEENSRNYRKERLLQATVYGLSILSSACFFLSFVIAIIAAIKWSVS